MNTNYRDIMLVVCAFTGSFLVKSMFNYFHVFVVTGRKRMRINKTFTAPAIIWAVYIATFYYAVQEISVISVNKMLVMSIILLVPVLYVTKNKNWLVRFNFMDAKSKTLVIVTYVAFLAIVTTLIFFTVYKIVV